jgi:hypothetical protein
VITLDVPIKIVKAVANIITFSVLEARDIFLTDGRGKKISPSPYLSVLVALFGEGGIEFGEYELLLFDVGISTVLVVNATPTLDSDQFVTTGVALTSNPYTTLTGLLWKVQMTQSSRDEKMKAIEQALVTVGALPDVFKGVASDGTIPASAASVAGGTDATPIK